MNSKHRPYRQFICEVCGQLKSNNLKNRNICKTCHAKELSTCCMYCRLMRHRVEAKTGLCPHCTEIVELKQASQCSVCGQIRSLVKERRQAICKSCDAEKNNGRRTCAKCKQCKIIYYKSEQLCKQCNKNRLAAKALHKYVTNFVTPYPYNWTLFHLLVTTIDWESLTDQTNRRFRTFGHFLQTCQLPQPLSWEAIEEALPHLGQTNRARPKMIRSCLFDLGHFLAAKGQLESWEAYVKKRNALRFMTKTPEHIQPLLHRYTHWLWEQHYKPRSVGHHLETQALFWLWCDEHGIKSPESVQSSLLNDYLLTLRLQWECSECLGKMALEPHARKAPKLCTHCGAADSIFQAERYAQKTVSLHESNLRVFFDWAKLNRMVLFNPVCRQVKASSSTIVHYSVGVIEQLCDYIKDPNANPTEALVLCLIIFYGLSVDELRHAKIPTVLPLNQESPMPTLAEAYYLILPKPPVSRGDRSPGRLNPRLEFPPNAKTWLKPLLERFSCQRQQRLRNLNNQYLLVTLRRHNTPVSNWFVHDLVKQASLSVLGAACNPKTLRTTAAVMFTDKFGAGVLTFMGFGEQQAFVYSWASREVIHPQPPKSSRDKKSQLNVASIDFPSPKPESLVPVGFPDPSYS